MPYNEPRLGTSPRSRGGVVALAACCAIGLTSAATLAQDESAPAKPDPAPAKAAASSLDDALLENLDNELLDGIGDLKDLPTTDKPRPAPADKPDQVPLEQDFEGEDIGQPAAEDDPLGYISQEMRLVEELIPQRSKRNYAEAVQRRIIEDLAKLIEQAERQRAQQQSSQSKQQRQQTAKRQPIKQPKPNSAQAPGKNSNKPAADSTDRLGRAERARPDPALFQGLLKDSWGNLPQREREQMMQMSPERFLPQYELMIERYYRRLAEEGSN